MAFAHKLMGLIIILLGIFIAIVGWVTDLVTLNLVAAVPLVLIGFLMIRGKIK